MPFSASLLMKEVGARVTALLQTFAQGTRHDSYSHEAFSYEAMQQQSRRQLRQEIMSP